MSAMVERVGNTITVVGTSDTTRARHYAGRLVRVGEQLARGKGIKHPTKLGAYVYRVRKTSTDVASRTICPLHGKRCETWATLGAGE